MKQIIFELILLLSCVGTNAAERYWSTTINGSMETVQGVLEDGPVKEGLGCDTTKQLSGYFKIKASKSKNYFYWFFESRSNPSSDPTMIWLTGGPGCSSLLALMMENGPCSVQDDMTLKKNLFSWNSKANIMWIDQPAGVGFSYGDVSEYDTSEKQVGEDMYEFLQAFFEAHPIYSKQKFYVFGESYGGHYVPAVAYRIYQGNKHLTGSNIRINLAGIGIGNGLTDPAIQYKYYPEMAFKNTYNVQAITQSEYNTMKKAIPICVKMIEMCQKVKQACFVAEMFCNAALVSPYQLSGLNVYDIREKCHKFPMCYDFSNVEKFFDLESTRKALHVTEKSAKWKSCNMVVHAGFTYDWMNNFDTLVTPMLEDVIRVLVYAGDADFIVNWMGCKAWTLALPWKHASEFKAAKDMDWIVNKEKAGKIRSVKGFTFLQVFNAGHMVPMNQPANALQMLDDFIQDKTEVTAIA